MNGKIVAIYGASGCGRGVAPLLSSELGDFHDTQIVFVDDQLHGNEINGLPVWSFEQFAAADNSDKQITIAIADGAIRKRLAEKCAFEQIPFRTIKAHQHVSMSDVVVGEGAIFSPFTTVTSNVRIGDHFHCNIGSYVEHDCVIGDYVTFAPGVKCNGNVHIHDHAYIGTGAILKQGTPDKPLVIGTKAVVGMGAVVTKNVEPAAVVVGNPARPMGK